MNTKTLIALSLVLFSTQAAAVDMDFYVYGGFDVTVNAFSRIALIFNDGEYVVMFFVAAVFGILFGGMIASGKALLGGGGNNASIINFLILVLIGTGLFKALIIPKGTVHIYDPVVNRYQAIGNVPDLIVLGAGLSNKAERILTEVTDNGSAHPRKLQGGGIGLEMMINAYRGEPFGDQAYIQKTLNQYISDCLPPAETLSGYSFDLQKLKSTTSNIQNELGQLRSDAVFTTVFSASKKYGDVQSCKTAWDGTLKNALTSTSNYQEYLKHVCAQSGLSTDTAGLFQCSKIISDAQDILLNSTASGDYRKFFADIVISKAIVSSLMDTPGSALKQLANKDIVSGGFASQIVSEGWLPAIKAVVFGVVLGLFPVMALFFVTPLVFKALHTMLGLLLWLALWGVTDAVVHGIAMDQVLSMASGMQNMNTSLMAIMMVPEQATKGLAILGKAQSMGVILATFIAGAFFRISGYAFSQLSEKWQQDIDRFGDKASQETIDPIGRTDAVKSHIGAQSTMTSMGMLGIEGFSVANQMMTHTPYAHNLTQNQALRGGGMSTQEALMASGVYSGAENAGQTLHQVEHAQKHYGGLLANAGESIGRMSSEMHTGSVEGQHQAFSDVSLARGMPTDAVIKDSAHINQAKEVTGALSYKDDVVANNPSLDLTGAIHADRSAETLRETASNRIWNERNSQAQIVGDTDRVGAAQKQQMIETADGIGRFYATGGDSAPYVEQSVFTHDKSLGHTSAEAGELEQRNVGVREYGEMSGRVDALHTLGENKAVQTAGEASIIDGKHVNSAKEALGGSVEIGKAIERELPLSHQLLSKAETDEAHAYGETTARQIREGATGMQTDDMAVAQSLAKDAEMVVSGTNSEHIHANLGTTGSAAEVATREGGLLDVKVDDGGQVVTARGFSGLSGTQDSLLSVERGLNLNQGASQMNQGSYAYALENRYGETAQDYQMLFEKMGDESVRETVLAQMAQELDSTMHSNVTYQDIYGHREEISVSVGVPQVAQMLSPVDAELSARGYAEGSATDQDVYNANKLILNSFYDQARNDADEYIKEVYRPNTPDATDEEIRRVSDTFASGSFAEYYQGYRDTLLDLGNKKTRTFSDKMNEEGRPDYSDVKIPDMKHIK